MKEQPKEGEANPWLSNIGTTTSQRNVGWKEKAKLLEATARACPIRAWACLVEAGAPGAMEPARATIRHKEGE